MKRPFLLLVLMLPLVAACGSGEVEPRVVEGLADANADGTAIGLSDDESDDDGQEGYIVAGADYRQGDGPTHQGGSATCIKPGAVGQRVRLGLVTVDGGDGFGTREHVVWVHCLDR